MMAGMKHVLAILTITAGMSLTIPAFAQSAETEAEQRLKDGLASIMDALSSFLSDIPRYEAPEILPNGDSIIRRIPNDTDRDGEGRQDDETVTTDQPAGRTL